VIAPVVVVLDEADDLGLRADRQVLVSKRIRFFRVWLQRSTLPWVWGCMGAPRTWLMLRASI
jgi:hypothetical protein